MQKLYKVEWSFNYNSKDLCSEFVWAFSANEAKSIVAKSNHLIYIIGASLAKEETSK